MSRAAHSIRNSIAVINGYTMLLSSGALGAVDAGHTEGTTAIESAARKVLRILADLEILESRQDIGDEIEPLDVALLEAVMEVGAAAGRRGVIVELAPTSGVARVRCGHAMLRSLFDHLLEEAAATVESGGRVDATLKGEGDQLVTTVVAEPTIVTAEMVSVLADPFFKLPLPEALDLERTGLALPVAEALARRAGGSFHVALPVRSRLELRVALPAVRG